MKRFALGSCAFVAFGFFMPVLAQDPAAKRFAPDKHIAGPSLLHISVGNVARLKAKLASTLFGRIATHPGSVRAFADLASWLEELSSEATDHCRELTGKTPLEIVGLIQGEVSFSLRSVSPNLVEAVLAVELGAHKDEILGVVSRIRSKAEEAGGEKLAAVPFEGGEATAWPMPWGQGVSGDRIEMQVAVGLSAMSL